MRLRTWTRCVAALGCAVLLAGCAAKEQLARGQGLADSGIAYADSLRALTTAACGAVVEWDSRALLTIGDGIAKVPDETAAPRLERWLADHDRELDEIVGLCRELDAHLTATKDYFAALKAFVEYGYPDALKAQVAALATAIDGLNDTATLSKEKQAALGKLAELAAQSTKSGLLQQQLRADAATIAKSLDWQDELLGRLGEAHATFAQANGEKAYAQAVAGPYATRKIKDREAWIARRSALRITPYDTAAFRGAQNAARRLRAAWVLAGAARER